ncbi:MAG: hypothetical protein CMJ83_15815 [Planctomycetes bacterium]|nr:hypothetical protein [Planctomycetota bacterium]
MLLRVFSLFLVPLSAIVAQVGPLRDAAIEDLVRASSGRLSLYARNVTTGKQLSLNGIGSQYLGSLTRVVVAGAALAAIRTDGTAEATLAYPPEAYRGARGPLGAVHDRRYGIRELVAAAVRDDDPAAVDLLIQWLGPRLAAWRVRRGLRAWGRIASEAQRDAFLLGRLDAKFSEIPAHLGARWLHDRESAAIVPAWFPTDPRRDADHVGRLGAAWDAWYADGARRGSPKGFADLLENLQKGATGSTDDVVHLLHLMRGVRRVACAQELPLHVTVTGLDAGSHRRRTSAAIVETSKGTIVVVTHAKGYARDRDADHFLAILGHAAVRRLAPGALRPVPVVKKRPRALRQLVVLEATGQAPTGPRDRFTVGETARVKVDVAPTSDAVIVARWALPDGSHRREAAPARGGAFTSLAFDQPLMAAGPHDVAIALGAQVLERQQLQVRK